MKCIVCLQSVWIGTLAVDTEQCGLCWQQCSVFLCHRQLCTAVLVCAREEEHTWQRNYRRAHPYPLPKTLPLTKSAPLALLMQTSFLFPCQVNIQPSIFPQIAAFIHHNTCFIQQSDIMWTIFSQLKLTSKKETSFPAQNMVSTCIFSSVFPHYLQSTAITPLTSHAPILLKFKYPLDSPLVTLSLLSWARALYLDSEQCRWWISRVLERALRLLWIWVLCLTMVFEWVLMSKLGLVQTGWLKSTWGPQRHRKKRRIVEKCWRLFYLTLL